MCATGAEHFRENSHFRENLHFRENFRENDLKISRKWFFENLETLG